MFQEWDTKIRGVKDYPSVREAARRWVEAQDGQQILLTTPSVLVGFRVEVYRAEGTTQWYTAVICGYNEATHVSIKQSILLLVIVLLNELLGCNFTS